MKALILSALLIVSSVVSADAPLPPGGFVPVLLFYVKGSFVELKQAGDPEDTITKCMDKVSAIVGKLMASEERPVGASALGGCLPVPAAPKVAAKGADAPYHDNKPSSLGGINTEKIST